MSFQTHYPLDSRIAGGLHAFQIWTGMGHLGLDRSLLCISQNWVFHLNHGQPSTRKLEIQYGAGADIVGWGTSLS